MWGGGGGNQQQKPILVSVDVMEETENSVDF